MSELQLDPALHETLRSIRESVRNLFEQLRLKHESGDISGKERLERVPALAKRNFASLTGVADHLATKQAWRLVDFLEGSDGGRLSPRARESLRVVELDKKLAALRASDCWKGAALSLRTKLGGDCDDLEAAQKPLPCRAQVHTEAHASASKVIHEPPVGPAVPLGCVPRLVRLLRRNALIGATALASAAVILGAKSWFKASADPHYACLPLETASKRELAAHRAPWSGTPLPRPPRAQASQKMLTISDLPNGGPLQSIWTTSRYSYAEATSQNAPGGGRSDTRLRVGGWGDTYLSLLQVPIPSDRLAHRAVIQLTVVGDEVGSRPTPMSLRAIGDDWRVSSGTKNRMWWRDCPRSEAIANHLPPPGARGSVYEIDITDLYNMWASGIRPAYGIVLEPEQIGSWGPHRPQYPSFDTFYSTRARDHANRPRLILTY